MEADFFDNATCGNSSDIFDRMENIEHSAFLRTSELLMLGLSLVALPVGALAFYQCSHCVMFHINTKIIATLSCVGLMGHCVGSCLISRSLHTFGIYYTSFTSVILSIEKSIATYNAKEYEHMGAAVGWLLVFGQAALSLVMTVLIFVHEPMPDRLVHCALDLKQSWTFWSDIVTLVANVAAFYQCYRMFAVNAILREKADGMVAVVKVKEEGYFQFLRDQWKL
uniref:Uncharacterized protein n=1 Tax=Caenorhabditis japonica TaxID=281687 RepID=A0A8R1E194_CAEJA